MHNVIQLEGTFNTRDIGGIVNSEGKTIRYGLMLRSDALHAITTKDVEILKKYGLKTIIDFRSVEEIVQAPDVKIANVQTINLSPHAAVAELGSGNIVDDRTKIDTLLEESRTQEGRKRLTARMDEMADQMKELVNNPYAINKYAEFIDILLVKDNLPLLHHCKGGKDRTGYATLITLLALDVDIDVVRQEYMLTKNSMAQRNEKRMEEYRQYTDNEIVLHYLFGLMQTKEIYFNAAIEEMLRMSGSVSKYLEEYLKLTKDKKLKLKEIFLET